MNNKSPGKAEGGFGGDAGAPWSLTPRADVLAPVVLPEPFYNRYGGAEGYQPDEALIAAVNVALLLGQPLLVTGEPGSGKTTLAYWLARQMGLAGPEVLVVKSTTSGKDLLYSFDELARFRDAQSRTPRSQQAYIEFNALGRAILFSAGPDVELKQTSTARAASALSATPTNVAAGEAADADAAPRRLNTHADLYQGQFPTRRRQVVLIDELDKATRDTPNDLLSEIENMSFRIPELGVSVTGDPENRPIVVITSNTEKSLPEPFLRRCVYFDIPKADHDRRLQIIAAREVPFAERGKPFVEAMQLFETLRISLARPPGTAEMLAWLDILMELFPKPANGAGELSIYSDNNRLKTSLSALAKTRDDLDLARRQIDLARS